ncbi:MAG TPA: type 2 lanthipeptide synthetase LanM family protein, partial [Blastocatellia bacterium]|nr:type 2 lanthipeptide synthetase LanM family protein [Blastocatellia bacterium]
MSIDVKEASFESAVWFNALSLTERAGMLDRFNATRLDSDMDRGSRRLARWRSQLPFTTDSQFGRRLEHERLTEEQFVKLLGEKPESVRARCSETPRWLMDLESLFAGQSSPNAAASPQVPSLNTPLIRTARDRFRRGIESLSRRHSLVSFDPAAVEGMFLPYLLQQFAKVTNRTVVLEVNVARVQGLLEGETAEERYKSFAERLQRPEVMLSLLEEYPVLARQLLIRIDQWVGFSLEFLNNLCADWEEIHNTFPGAGDLGKLSGVSLGAGDTHKNGRSVVIASFSNGAKLVYKPRSLTVDVHYGQLLAWLNDHGDHPSFRALKTLDRRTHGWQEFAAFETCADAEQVERFYRRLGGLLALLYALEATDFHLENLIAAGEHPVLVDLEALFHPRVHADFSAMPAAEVMSQSVLRIGLLPQRMWLGGEQEGLDLSGVGGAEGQLTPFELPALEGVGTDEMRVVRKRMPIPGSQNRPKLNGEEVNAESYVESVVAGFTSVYQTILEHRSELTAHQGRIAAFADDEVRVVLRPTRTYGLLLTESFHPDVLRNALDRDRLFDCLWGEVEYRPYLSRLIASEQAELRRGDIPAFYTRPNSRDVWAGTGERIANFFEVTSSEMVARRLAAFSEQDLDRQIWFIRASMTSLNSGLVHEKWRGYKPASDVRPAEKRDLIAAACALGDRLEMLAIRSADTVSWIGVVMINDRAWSLLPLGDDLYGGALGIALFLGYLGALTGVERYTELARSAL